MSTHGDSEQKRLVTLIGDRPVATGRLVIGDALPIELNRATDESRAHHQAHRADEGDTTMTTPAPATSNIQIVSSIKTALQRTTAGDVQGALDGLVPAVFLYKQGLVNATPPQMSPGSSPTMVMPAVDTDVDGFAVAGQLDAIVAALRDADVDGAIALLQKLIAYYQQRTSADSASAPAQLSADAQKIAEAAGVSTAALAQRMAGTPSAPSAPSTDAEKVMHLTNVDGAALAARRTLGKNVVR